VFFQLARFFCENHLAPDQPAICSHLFGQLAPPQRGLELPVPQESNTNALRFYAKTSGKKNMKTTINIY
jgi:hypothetical protein